MRLAITCLCLVLLSGFFNKSFAAARFWVAAGPSNWNNTANWSNISGGAGGQTVPGAGDAVTFNNLGSGNCTIDIAVNILSLTIIAGYTGTITQGANSFSTVNNATIAGGTFTAGASNFAIGGTLTYSGGTLTGGSGNISTGGILNFSGGVFNGGSGNFTTGGNFTFSGGTFNGGSANITVTGNIGLTAGIFSGGTGFIKVTGNYTLNGATFTSTSGKLELDGNGAFTTATFAHNNGTVQFNATSGASTISGISPAFYILELVGNGFSYTVSSAGNITVANSLNITGTSAYNINTGTIDVSGDINITNTATGCAGTGTVEINGPGVQNYNGSTIAGAGALPKLSIIKPSGTLNLSNFPSSSNAFTYTSGMIAPGTSTYCFTNGSNSPYAITGSITFNSIEFNSLANTTYTITAGTTLTATSDLTMAGTNRITLNTGSLNINGNINLTNIAANGGGTATINIVGAGNETMDGSALAITQNLLPFINITKPSGTLTLKGNITESRSWTYTSGTVDAATFTSTVVFGTNVLNVTSNGMSFYNVLVTGGTITLLNNMTALNNIRITAGRLAPVANTINIGGNWNDYGTAGFTEATSTMNFNGTALQTITSPAIENFTNLTINNTGAGVQLINAVTVATSLKMTQGNIDLNSNTLTLGLSVANNGTLSYTAGTIINTGTFTRWFKTGVIATGSVTGLFPMGTASDYRPFFVSAPAAGPTTGGIISVSYNDATTNTYIPTYMDGAATIQVRKDLNWSVSTNNLAGGTYNLQVQGTGFGLIGAVSDLRLTLANAVIGTPGVNAGTTLNPQINRTGLTVANLTNSFYAGSINSVSTPLPITLISFSAFPYDNKVEIKWSTASESDNAFFIIQRSNNSVSGWEDVEKIPGAGTTSSMKYYSVYDTSPLTGISYYRLIQTDIDGKQTYSHIVAVSIDSKTSSISFYPNPATDHIIINFPTKDKYAVSVLNLNGQIIQRLSSNPGNKLELNVSGLPSGVYFLHIMHSGISETKKIIVSR